jgi:hypothetical protein
MKGDRIYLLHIRDADLPDENSHRGALPTRA